MYADKYPDSYLYVPALRRVRMLGTSERFESPTGMTLYLSEYDFHSDPILTWDYKLIEKKPMLCTMAPFKVKWPTVDGSSIDLPFPQSVCQLRPEIWVVETYPTGFPNSPYTKKVFYMEPLNNFRPYSMDTYDKGGQLWKLLYDDNYDWPQENGEYEPDKCEQYCIDFLKNECCWFPSWNEHNSGYKITDHFTPKAINQIYVYSS
jgi:hypothetical protein